MHYSRTEKNRAPWIGAKNRPDLSLLQQTGKTVLFKHIDHLVAGIILPVSVSILLPTHHRISLPRPSLAVVPLVLPHVATVRRLHHLPLCLSVPSSLRHRHLSRRRRTSLLTPSTSPHGRISFSGTGYVSFTENTCSKSLAFAVHPIAFKNSNYASLSAPAQTSLIPAVAPSCSRSSSSSFDSFAFSTMFITFAISSLFSAKPSFKSPRFLCGSE